MIYTSRSGEAGGITGRFGLNKNGVVSDGRRRPIWIFGIVDGRPDEAQEHWLGAQRAAGELGVGLGAHEERMYIAAELEDLHDGVIGGAAGEHETVALKG